jgi:hypothetical protein
VKFILGALAGVAVTVGEQSLGHVSNTNRLLTGAVIALPFLVVLLVMHRRARRAGNAKPATPAARPAYRYGGAQ